MSSASVSVDDTQISSIKNGFLILLGVQQEDDEKDLEYLVNKAAGMRIFKDDKQHMNLSWHLGESTLERTTSYRYLGVDLCQTVGF